MSFYYIDATRASVLLEINQWHKLTRSHSPLYLIALNLYNYCIKQKLHFGGSKCIMLIQKALFLPLQDKIHILCTTM